MNIKVKKKAKNTNQYNQVPHLSLDIILQNDKTQGTITHNRAKRSALSKKVVASVHGTDKTVNKDKRET